MYWPEKKTAPFFVCFGGAFSSFFCYQISNPPESFTSPSESFRILCKFLQVCFRNPLESFQNPYRILQNPLESFRILQNPSGEARGTARTPRGGGAGERPGSPAATPSSPEPELERLRVRGTHRRLKQERGL